MDFVEKYQPQNLSDTGDRIEQMKRVGVVLFGMTQDFQLDLVEQAVVKVDPLQIESDIGLDAGIGEPFSHAFSIAPVGDFLSDLGKVVLVVGVLDMGQQLRTLMHDASGAAYEVHVRKSDGTHVKIPQEADVVIEDDVEIGSNSTIDRPAVGETRIAAGTKIDNLVHVAHGVAIGKRVLLAAQTGIAGSTVVEDDVMMAGQSGVTGHIRIGRGAKVGAKSAVLQSVDAGAFVTGHPAIEHAEWRKASVVFRQLPSLK